MTTATAKFPLPSSATTTAAAAKFASSTAAAGTLFAGACDIDCNRASIQLRAIHGGDGLLRFLFRAHRHKTEAARAIGVAINHEIGLCDCAVCCKCVIKRIF